MYKNEAKKVAGFFMTVFKLKRLRTQKCVTFLTFLIQSLKLLSLLFEYPSLFQKFAETVAVAALHSVAVLRKAVYDVVYLEAERLLVQHEKGSPHDLVELCHAGQILEASRAESELLAVGGTFYIGI